MHGRYLHNADGTTAFQPYGKEIVSSSILFQEANWNKTDGSGRTTWSKRSSEEMCKSIDWQKEEISFENTCLRTLQTSNRKLQPLFRQRRRLFCCLGSPITCNTTVFNTSNILSTLVIKNWTYLPAKAEVSWWRKNALHIWPRGVTTCLLHYRMLMEVLHALYSSPVEGHPSFAS